jgi:hypothetical protein
MTRERVEPGIWRRGEVFEITWRDAQAKQRRKTVQGGITASEGAHRCQVKAGPWRAHERSAADLHCRGRRVVGGACGRAAPEQRERLQRRAAAPSGRLPAQAPCRHRPHRGRSPRLIARCEGLDRQGRDDGPVGRLHPRRPPSWPPGQNPVTLLDHVERPSSADEKPKRILAGRRASAPARRHRPRAPPHLRDGRRDGRTVGRDVRHRLARGRSRRGDDHPQPPA